MLGAVGRAGDEELLALLADLDRAVLALLDRSPRGPATRTTSGSIVTLTPVGRGMGFLPIRDMVGYQICATSSPPTPCLRASWPVITPLEVDTIAVPMPPSTLGIDFEST